MVLDVMRRARVSYDKILRVCKPDIEAIVDIEERKLRSKKYRVLAKKLQRQYSFVLI